MGDDRAHGDERHPEVGGGEREPPRVPLGDVGDAGEHHEDPAPDQREQADPLDDVAGPLHRRQGDETGPHHPQLGDEHRHRGDAGDHVDALAEPVQAGGPGRDRQPRLRMLLEVRVQPGDEADGEQDPERGAEVGGHPLVAQRRFVDALVQGLVEVRRQAADAGRQTVGEPGAHSVAWTGLGGSRGLGWLVWSRGGRRTIGRTASGPGW